MAQKKKAAPPPPSDEELTQHVLNTVRDGAANKAALGKRLAKRDQPRALELARELARQGTIHRWAKGAAEVFFPEEPIARLDRLVPELLRREGPLDATALKMSIKKAAPHHEVYLADWLKPALARQVIYERPGKPKAFVPDPPKPDLGQLLKKPLAELQKLLGGLEALGVSRAQVVDFLRNELGAAAGGESRAIPGPPNARADVASRDVFLSALRRFAADNPQGALLPVRELRARAGLAKQEFDAAALALSREGLLVLHHHDHAAALSEAEQNALVRDTLGRHYVGVALRGSA
jgi:hypothetical protein